MTYKTVALALSPSIYCSFDADNTPNTFDSSGNGRNGANNGTVTRPASLLGDGSGLSASFNGTNQFIAWISASYMNASSFTFVARFKYAGSIPYVGRFGSAGNRPWLLYTASGQLAGAIDGSGTLVSSATTLVSGNTYTIGVRADGTNFDLFVDGVRDGRVAHAGPTQTSGDLELGRAAGAAYGTGTFDEAGFWFGTALSDANMLALHNAAIASGPAGPLVVSAPHATFSASGSTTVPSWTGPLAVTAPHATFSASGTATPPSFTGTLAGSAHHATFAATGTVTPPFGTGTMDVRAAPATFSATGTTLPPPASGPLVVTAPHATFSASGTTLPPPNMGTLAATAPHAVFSATGPYTPAAITGTLNVGDAAGIFEADGFNSHGLGLHVQAAPAVLVLSGFVVETVDTDLTYGNDGYVYGGEAEAELAVAVSGSDRANVRRVHESLPIPTLVNGRPR